MLKTLNILLIEDEPIEVMKFKRVLSTLALNHKITEAKNGEEALQILRSKEFRHDIIVLDIDLPKLSGIELLGVLKSDANLKFIPTIMLTNSENHKDISYSYRSGINGYILKPLKYDDYVLRIKSILDYWSCNEIIFR
jgi:CheY-like chemotaxis protein